MMNDVFFQSYKNQFKSWFAVFSRNLCVAMQQETSTAGGFHIKMGGVQSLILT